MFVGFQAIAQGESHKENSLPCQDAVFYGKYEDWEGIIAVADGHGSEKHFRSEYGSRIAVQVAKEAIPQFFTTLFDNIKKLSKEEKRSIKPKYIEEQLKQLERYIISQWREKVLEHFSENSLHEFELKICEEQNLDVEQENTKVRLYGTTLIAGLMTPILWFVIQIGDGKCVMLDEQGKPSFPVPEDESLGGGKTTSLCDSNAIENFRHKFGAKQIKGLTVATDGVTDSFIPEDYLSFHERLYADISRDEKSTQDNIEKALPQWSIKGSRDDVAMAGIFLRQEAAVSRASGSSAEPEQEAPVLSTGTNSEEPEQEDSVPRAGSSVEKPE